MNDVIEKLLVVQDRDSRIHKLNTEKTRIPVDIESLKQRIAAARAKVDAGREQAKQSEKEQKRIDGDIEAKKGTVAKFKTQLLSIKKNEEFHALQHEIQAVETEIRSLEDQEIGFMEQLEGIKKTIQTEEASCKTVVTQLDNQIADLEKRSKLIDSQLEELQKSRTELTAGVEPAALSLYERIMKSKKDAAIVGIHLGNCQGCHIKLTTQTYHNVKANREIISCTNCGRILYWNPEMGN
jgi:uncharacterized protein